MTGDVTAKKEFHELTSKISAGGDDVVAAVMSGKLPEMASTEQRLMAGTAEMFRELGIRDEVTSEFLRGVKVTPQEYELVLNWKKEQMGDTGTDGFVKRYLAGDTKAHQQMTIANTILVNGVKEPEAAA